MLSTALKLPCTGVLQPSVWGEASTIQVLGQPWFIPSASSILLSELLGRCRSIRNLLANMSLHTYMCTSLPSSSYTTHRSYSTLHAEQMNFHMAPSHHHILLQGHVLHTLIRPILPVTKSDIFGICIQIYFALLSPKPP